MDRFRRLFASVPVTGSCSSPSCVPRLAKAQSLWVSPVVDQPMKWANGHKGARSQSVQRVPTQRHEDSRYLPPIRIEPKEHLIVTVGACIHPTRIRSRVKVLHARDLHECSRPVASVTFLVADLVLEKAFTTSEPHAHRQCLTSSFEREKMETTGGREPATHCSKKLRLAGIIRHCETGDSLVSRLLEAEEPLDGSRVCRPVHQDRFCSEVLCHPPSPPPKLSTRFRVDELLVIGFWPPSHKAALPTLVHDEGEFGHPGGCSKCFEDGSGLSDVREDENSRATDLPPLEECRQDGR